MYDSHFFKSTCYTLDQCHLCERGNRVPYFLKRFRNLCVWMDKRGYAPSSLLQGGGGHVSTPFFFVMVAF